MSDNEMSENTITRYLTVLSTSLIKLNPLQLQTLLKPPIRMSQ